MKTHTPNCNLTTSIQSDRNLHINAIMGRSNTAPIKHSYENSSSKRLNRSATTTRVPETKSPHHHMHLPHPHIPIPFRHGHSNDQQTEPPSTRPSNSSKHRPGNLNRQNSVQTRYMDMLLSLDTIPRLHNILASFFTWLLLAGFLVFPGTFTSIASLGNDPNIHSQTAAKILRSVKHVQLLVVAGVCSGFGAGGMICLYWRWRQNFVWLLNKIFLPGCLNSFAGLISTLINVYSQQGGTWVSRCPKFKGP